MQTNLQLYCLSTCKQPCTGYSCTVCQHANNPALATVVLFVNMQTTLHWLQLYCLSTCKQPCTGYSCTVCQHANNPALATVVLFVNTHTTLQLYCLSTWKQTVGCTVNMQTNIELLCLSHENKLLVALSTCKPTVSLPVSTQICSCTVCSKPNKMNQYCPSPEYGLNYTAEFKSQTFCSVWVTKSTGFSFYWSSRNFRYCASFYWSSRNFRYRASFYWSSRNFRYCASFYWYSGNFWYCASFLLTFKDIQGLQSSRTFKYFQWIYELWTTQPLGILQSSINRQFPHTEEIGPRQPTHRRNSI